MNWKTRVTELLGIRYPIVQGGLAYLAYSELAAAVSNAGGLGQITAMSLSSPEELKKEIQKTREKTVQPFGVNFAIGQHGRPFSRMLQAAIDEEVQVISMTGGNPAPVFQQLEGVPVRKLVLVAARRQAEKAEELGADAVMAVGHEGGGHLGKTDTGTMVLIPSIVESVSIPVIASGGIADGKGLMAALALGAEGIEMGTRFIAVKECIHAHSTYKEDLLNADENGTVLIKKTIGAPGRALSNDWTTRILDLEDTKAAFEGLRAYIDGAANKKYINEGKRGEGFGWAGQAAGIIHDIPSVKELFDRMMSEGEIIRKQWGE
ncbi:NAD(P)H-dependent flavin oxidoreductase [Metabacillus sp. 113a]|uniref:NAD(P)H-dependent flavin oxidoreductase n=1 Tax=Metabacillus sp. 113a TaxID=3404706 RepID=UPI003CFA252E